MKTIKLLTYFLLFSSTIISAQEDVKKQAESKTKTEAFISKTGTIIKFIDFKLTPLKTSYATCETRVRKITSGAESLYCLQIVKEGKYGDSKASITLLDLVELIKAFNKLKSSVEADLTSTQDYLENKFVTDDGFSLGYYADKGKATWFIKLEKYGSDNTVYLNGSESIEELLNSAKSKIEELKK